jgi:hypothetical protein
MLSFNISVFEEMNAPKACSIAERKAFKRASSSVFPVPETVKVTVLSNSCACVVWSEKQIQRQL